MWCIIKLNAVAETQLCLLSPLGLGVRIRLVSIHVLRSWSLTRSNVLHYWAVVNALKFRCLGSFCSKTGQEWERGALKGRNLSSWPSNCAVLINSLFPDISLQLHSVCLFHWMVKRILQREQIRLAASKGRAVAANTVSALCSVIENKVKVMENLIDAQLDPSDSRGMLYSSTAGSLSSTTTRLHHRLRLTSH